MSFLQNNTVTFEFQNNEYAVTIDQINTKDSELDYWWAFKDVKGQVYDINIYYNDTHFTNPLRFTILQDYKVKFADSLHISS